MITIKLDTTFTPYSKAVPVKPRHPLWYLKNTGTSGVVINGVSYIPPRDGFGIDSLPILVPVIQEALKNNPGEKITIENNTQFSITFEDNGGTLTNQVMLIETSINIVR